MSFDSLTYLLFLPLTVLAHWLCPKKWRYLVLLAASAVFYMSWSVPLGLLLAATILVTWLSALLMDRLPPGGRRNAVFAMGVVFCLGLLFYFKYFTFLAESLRMLFHAGWHLWEIVLPVGISFYVFQAMSYLVDVRRGGLRPERHLGYYALYICFFPQLVAGPIERADHLLPQLRAERTLSRQNMREGLRLLCAGFFRKLVIADTCGRVVDRVFALPAPDGLAVGVALLLFGLQIYCDFAGYSEIAQGSALMVGIRLMRNFDQPYRAASLREFWRRWHISLSRWLTDYVYIPLGGSRHGRIRQALCTLAVFALSGLWHGADWRFLLWGLLHGALMCIERLLPGGWRRRGIGHALAVALTFLIVQLLWVFFRAEHIGQAFFLLSQLLQPWSLAAGWQALALDAPDIAWLLLAAASLPLMHRLSLPPDQAPVSDLSYVYLGLAVAVAWALRAAGGGANAFIYFQF